MGADIHMYVEKKKNEEWKAILGPNPYGKDYTDWTGTWVYNGRNYDLFAFLADVRNYDSIDPIDEPRDLPEDVSSFIQKKSDDWGVDGHSHTYFYLDELLEIKKEEWENIDKLFYEKVIEKLKILEGDEIHSVRLVFWFDN